MLLLATTTSGFEKEARAELARVLKSGEGHVRVSYTYFKGLLALETSFSRGEALDMLKAAETQYVRRIIPLDGVSRDIKEAENFFQGVDVEDKRFAVRCNRRGRHGFSGKELEIKIGSRLNAKGGIVDLDEPELLFLVEILQDRYYYGVLAPDEILLKEVSIERKWAPGERPVSRAELKMRELMEMFPEIFQKGFVALDAGAAPGGWSRAMSEKLGKVIAVDPGELSDEVKSLPNVVHLKVRAQELESGMAPELREGVDIVANDANVLHQESAGLSVGLAKKFLRETGHLLHTVKLGIDPATGKRAAKTLNDAVAEVIREFEHNGLEVIHRVKLKSNTKNEATLICR